MTQNAQHSRTPFGMKSGDAALLSILTADFFGSVAGALVHLTMVWWVLSQGVSGPTVSLLVLCIFLPLNAGVLLTGVAVDRFGSRTLLIWSKSIATCGAIACCILLATQSMTLPILALLAIVTYGAMAPSVAADISRVPSITRLATRRLETFHATNGIVLVIGQMLGLWGAGVLWDTVGPAAAVGLGVLMVLMSTAITWVGFPRDRIPPRSPLSIINRVKALSRSVLSNLNGPKIDLSKVFASAAIIATAQACIEVAFPIAIAAAQLPASALSMALVCAVITGVTATILAERTYASIHLPKALLGIAIALFAILLLATTLPGIVGFYIAVGTTSAAAAAAGTYTITAIQERMPVSLQAQAIGLWEFLVLSVGSVTILLTGFSGNWSLHFITFIAAISVFAVFWAIKRPSQI
ncbi:MAG: hypothetical protein AB8B71_20210 [Paracoccaceae bacterium]